MFLSNEKHFGLNRFYLLASILVGLLFPLLQFISLETESVIMTEIGGVYHEQIEGISSYSHSIIQNPTLKNSESKLNFDNVILVLFLIGMIFTILRIWIGLSKIYNLYKHGIKEKYLLYTEVLTQKEHLPFSIFKFIFFPADVSNSSNKSKILIHELHHVQAGHSWDIALVESVKIFFWWNPIVYLFKKELTIVHEYAADLSAINHGSKNEYCSLLMETSFPGVDLKLGHPFYQSFIKKRIDMIYRKNSSKLSLLKFILPFIALVFMAFIMADQTESKVDIGSERTDSMQKTYQEENDKKSSRDFDLYIYNNDEIYINGQKLKLSQLEDYLKIKLDSISIKNEVILKIKPEVDVEWDIITKVLQVASGLKLKAIIENIDSTQELKDTSQNVIKIESNGTFYLNGVAITREDLDKRIRELKASNSKASIIIEPDLQTASQNVIDVLDITYKYNVSVILSETEQSPATLIKGNEDSIKKSSNDECMGLDNGIFFKAEQFPYLEICKMENTEEANSCSRNTLSAYANNIKLFPKDALMEGFEGKVFFMYIINEKGKMVDFQLVNELPFKSLEEEGMKVMELLSEKFTFVPGYCDGHPIKMQSFLSFEYKLDESLKKYVLTKGGENIAESNQIAVIKYITDQGYLAFEYRSDMNVPSEIFISDPNGEIIYDKTVDYMYKDFRFQFFVPNKLNGKYKIEVRQGGKTTKSTMECNVF